MTRVLHVIAEMGVGGAEAVVAELVRSGPKYDWQSRIASAGGERIRELTEADLVEEAFVPLAGRRPTSVIIAARRLRRVLRDFRPDVTIAHNVGSTLTATMARATSPHGGALIAVFHGVARTDYRLAAMVLDHGPDSVIAVSEVLRDRLHAAGMRRTDVEVIANAVSIPNLPSRSVARRELELDPEVPVALCLARIVDQKRHDVLLNAWSQLPKPATLLLAGDGDQKAPMERLTDDLQIRHHVRFLGVRSDVARLLAAADVSTLASDWEGLPVAILESMAAGLPIVSTAVDGVAELVREGEGLLVPPGQPAALAKALERFLFDPEARRAAGRAAQSGVARRNDPEAMMRGYAVAVRRAKRGHGTSRLLGSFSTRRA
jgi:glycosyltransferase involved in cell wall biosynthesis